MVYTSDFSERNRGATRFFPKKRWAKSPKCFNVNRLLLSNICQIYVCLHVIGLNIDAYGLKFVTVIDIYARFITGKSSWSSNCRWATRQKIENFLFPKIAKRRDFLTQKSRRSAISRQIFASVHEPPINTNIDNNVREHCLQVLPKYLKGNLSYPIPDYVRNNQTGLKFHHLLITCSQ